MNKKKIIIIASVVLLAIILGVLGFLLFGGKKNDDKPNSDVIVSSIFLEINPSIRIDLDKDEKIINVVALNDDAKDITPNEFKGKEISETIDNITEKLVEKGYAKEEVVILINTTGKIKTENVKEILDSSLSKKEIKSNIIEPEITESSKELAKKLNISETKAAYIESITKENPEIKAEDIKDKSVGEITEIKEQSKEFTVNFDMDGTGDSAKVKNGEKVTKPANPTKNGYTFVEWQLNGVKFDFNTPITGDITLKAVWKKNASTGNTGGGGDYKNPPSDPKDKSGAWCTWNKNRPGGSTYYYTAQIDFMNMRSYTDKYVDLNNYRSDWGSQEENSKSSYCIAYLSGYISNDKTHEITIVIDSVTGEFIEQRKRELPKPNITMEQAEAIAIQKLAEMGLTSESGHVEFYYDGNNTVPMYIYHCYASDGHNHGITINGFTGAITHVS